MADQELASRGQRLGGALLDGVIFLVIELPVMFMFGVFQQITRGQGMTFSQTVGFFVFRKDKRCIHDLMAGTQVVRAQ